MTYLDWFVRSGQVALRVGSQLVVFHSLADERGEQGLKAGCHRLARLLVQRDPLLGNICQGCWSSRHMALSVSLVLREITANIGIVRQEKASIVTY